MQQATPVTNTVILKSLIEGIKNKSNVHAYLFEGEKGLFPCETAMQFAMALVCEGEGDIPCGRCTNCIQSLSGNNPDIKRMSLSDITSKKSVGADEIRSIISDVYTKPFSANKKVYIIEDGDSLTVQAQNAMLKVLEEPPSYAVFIICVTNTASILETVISRSRVVRFASEGIEQIVEYVKNKYPHMNDMAEFIASFSEGIKGKADILCENEDIMKMRDAAFDIFERLLYGRDESAVFDMCAFFEEFKATKNDESVIMTLDFILSFLNDMLRVCAGAKNMIVNTDKSGRICDIAAITGYDKTDFCASCVMETKQMLSRYVNSKAAVMRLALSMFYGKGEREI